MLDALLALTAIPVIALWALAATKGRRWSGAWLLTIAPLYLPMAEDGFLAVWYAIATPTMDPHAVRGLVHPHALGHVLGAGAATIVLGVLAAWIARRPLARGEAWAYNALFAVGAVSVAVALLELTVFYGHGLPTTPTEANAFGWPFWIAGILAWVGGLWLARPPHAIPERAP